jgi:hypothetical protein
MKKLVYLVVALGLLSIGLLTGCQKQSEESSMPSMPSTNAPEMPSTNAPATTNAPAQ